MDAAWAGVIGAVVGAFVTQGFNIWLDARRTAAQRVERERDRTHERDLRRLELDDAHRARLYNDRKAAYADFYGCYREYWSALDDARRARDRLDALGPVRWRAESGYTADIEALRDQSLPPARRLRLIVKVSVSSLRRVGAIRGRFAALRTADENSFEARRAMDQSLQLIELAASPAVRDAASELRERAMEVELQQMSDFWRGKDHDTFDESISKLKSAYDAVNGGERRLREAIQVELELGR